MVQPLWETVWLFLRKLMLQYALADLLLGIQPRELKTHVPTKTLL